jgi:hypothetical protein
MENDYLFSNHVSYFLVKCTRKCIVEGFVELLILDRMKSVRRSSKLAAAAGGEVQKQNSYVGSYL